jgi:hypothetical protein
MNGQPNEYAGRERQAEALKKRQPGMIVVVEAERDWRQHGQAEHHQQQAKNPLYDGPIHLDEGNADLEEALQAFDLATVGHEENHMIIGLNDGVMMSNNDLVTPNDGNNRRALR